MSNTERALQAEKYAIDHNVEICVNARNRETGETGIVYASPITNQVKFFSNLEDDGNLDRFITDFDVSWEITNISAPAGIVVNF